MSQSSNSTLNMNIFSELSTITADDKINPTTSEHAVKRAASDELGGEVKKVMVDHHSHENKISSTVSKSFDQPKFVSAAIMASSARTNVQMIPEISDEELLAMAIEFEKKYPQ
ncbi:unnamed protein product [Rotaria magnacalcarata]